MIELSDCVDPNLTANDRVSMYFEMISGRKMTRAEKIPLGMVIHGECIEAADLEMDWLTDDKKEQS